METRTEEPTTGHCPQSGESSQHFPTSSFFKISFNIIQFS
jgi:hypothetical protein